MGVALEPAMTKTRGRPQSERDDVSTKIDRSIVGKAKLIAAHRGTSAAALMSELLQRPIDQAYAQMLRELDAGAK